MIAGAQIEVMPAVAGLLALVAFVPGGIALHRVDAIVAGTFAGVLLAAQDDLAVAGLQTKEKLPVLGNL